MVPAYSRVAALCATRRVQIGALFILSLILWQLRAVYVDSIQTAQEEQDKRERRLQARAEGLGEVTQWLADQVRV